MHKRPRFQNSSFDYLNTLAYNNSRMTGRRKPGSPELYIVLRWQWMPFNVPCASFRTVSSITVT